MEHLDTQLDEVNRGASKLLIDNGIDLVDAVGSGTSSPSSSSLALNPHPRPSPSVNPHPRPPPQTPSLPQAYSLSSVLPNIISSELSVMGSKNVLMAQLADVVESMRLATPLHLPMHGMHEWATRRQKKVGPMNRTI